MNNGPERDARLRGEILRILDDNHRRQRRRLDDQILFGILERLHFDAYLNEVRTLLQDLQERGYVKFAEERDRVKGVVAIRKIQITPDGRDIRAGVKSDKAVDVG